MDNGNSGRAVVGGGARINASAFYMPMTPFDIADIQITWESFQDSASLFLTSIIGLF
ncbi:hypothetical protein OAK75_02110 [Bacteriovoracales bacterium]|nr:hypothetical protein [Bacteriovoracales bacterium]